MRISNNPKDMRAIANLQKLAEMMILAPEGSIENIHICAASGRLDGIFPTWNIEKLERDLSTLGPIDFLLHPWSAYNDEFYGHPCIDVDLNAPNDKRVRLIRVGAVYREALDAKGVAETGLNISCPAKLFTSPDKLTAFVDQYIVDNGLAEIRSLVENAEYKLDADSRTVFFPKIGGALMGPSRVLTLIKALKQYVNLDVIEPVSANL